MIGGHVFQGRYQAMVIEGWRGVVAMTRHAHLNPVRMGWLGLDKERQRQSRVTGVLDPGTKLVRKRLRASNDYRSSSWRVYQGPEAAPSPALRRLQAAFAALAGSRT